MPDGLPLVRQWTRLKMRGGALNGVTLAERAVEARVNPKTIRRDLQVFAEAGFPIEETSGRRGCKIWRLVLSSDTPDLKFTFEEALALYLAEFKTAIEQLLAEFPSTVAEIAHNA